MTLRRSTIQTQQRVRQGTKRSLKRSQPHTTFSLARRRRKTTICPVRATGRRKTLLVASSTELMRTHTIIERGPTPDRTHKMVGRELRRTMESTITFMRTNATHTLKTRRSTTVGSLGKRQAMIGSSSSFGSASLRRGTRRTRSSISRRRVRPHRLSQCSSLLLSRSWA